MQRLNSHNTLRRASTASFRGPRGKMTDEEEGKGKDIKSKQTKEFSEKGNVKRDVYKEYAKESNLGAVAVYLVMLIGAQTASIGKKPAPLLSRAADMWAPARNITLEPEMLGAQQPRYPGVSTT